MGKSQSKCFPHVKNELEQKGYSGNNFWNELCKICECENDLKSNKDKNTNETFWEKHCKNKKKKMFKL